MKITNGIIRAYKSKHGTEYSWNEFDSLIATEQPSISYADHSFVMDVLKRISGRTLTLVDASIQDKEQRKAMKDLVKGFFSEEMDHVASLMFSQEYTSDLAANCQNSDDVEVIDVEEIINS